MTVLIVFAVFLGILTFGAWLANIVIGPDPDLAGPWDPEA